MNTEQPMMYNWNIVEFNKDFAIPVVAFEPKGQGLISVDSLLNEVRLIIEKEVNLLKSEVHTLKKDVEELKASLTKASDKKESIMKIKKKDLANIPENTIAIYEDGMSIKLQHNNIQTFKFHD